MSEGPQLADAREAPDPLAATNGHEPKSPPEPLRLGNLDRRILAVVDPVQPGPDVRMQCVGLVREAQRQVAALPAPHPQGGTEALRALADEWQAEADDDERYLNGPSAHYTECQELPAVIARSRQHIRDLRALLAAAPAPTEALCPTCGHKPHPRPCEHHMGDGCPTAPGEPTAADATHEACPTCGGRGTVQVNLGAPGDNLVDRVAAAMAGWPMDTAPFEDAEAWRANAREALGVAAAQIEAVAAEHPGQAASGLHWAIAILHGEPTL